MADDKRDRLAERLQTPAATPPPAALFPSPEPGGPFPGPPGAPPGGEATGLRLTITATEDDLFVLNQSLAKLRDLVGGGTLRLSLDVEARTAEGTPIDRVRARNTVIEPLDEDPDVDVRSEWLGGS